MIAAGEVCLLEGGGQEQDEKKEFFCESEETQHYLILMCSRRAMLRINDRQYYMKPFTFLMHPFPEQSLTVESKTLSAYRYLHLQCSDTFLYKILKRNFCLMQIYTMAKPLEMEEVWKMMSPFLKPDQPSAELAEHALRLLLCLLLLPSDGSVTLAAEVPHYDKLTDLRSRIYRYPSQNWCVSEIAENLGISRTYFHKLYVMAFGTTCLQDVVASRIATAKMLLEITDSPISDIAQQCGFESEVYFLRQFRRRVGITPTAYRRVSRQENPEESV